MSSCQLSRSTSQRIDRVSLRGNSRRGLTLVEVLVALTMTLIVLGAMMAAFRYASQEMAQGRAVMEMANRARSVEDLLRADLESLTLDPRPYTDSTIPNGYFEYVEGAIRDFVNVRDLVSLVETPSTNYLGDYDDTLGMTIRASDGVLFRGRGLGGRVIESSLAEVLWFTTARDLNGSLTIEFEDSIRVHRRQLLIRPDLVLPTGLTAAEVIQFFRTTDVSARVVIGAVVGGTQTYDLVANNLLDLSRRENRFCHDIFAFPNNPRTNPVISIEPAVIADARQSSNGEDILLTDVAAFDLRVFSPNALVLEDTATNLLIEPGDVGWRELEVQSAQTPSTLPATVVAAQLGAYVDLGYSGLDATTTPPLPEARGDEWFAQQALTKGGVGYRLTTPRLLPGSNIVVVTGGIPYDTWTPSYEADGVDQDGIAGADQATNGVDDGGTPAPDDNAERETLPPYAHPIRGIQVTLRLVEKGTKQVYQTSIIHSYVPE